MSRRRGLDRVRAIADAVLYEGYLLYPYRASSAKNQSRWQFGVLGPPRAPRPRASARSRRCPCSACSSAGPGAGVGDRAPAVPPAPGPHGRGAASATAHRPVDELVVDGRSLLSWDEAVECEAALPAYDLGGAAGPPGRP